MRSIITIDEIDRLWDAAEQLKAANDEAGVHALAVTLGYLGCLAVLGPIDAGRMCLERQWPPRPLAEMDLAAARAAHHTILEIREADGNVALALLRPLFAVPAKMKLKRAPTPAPSATREPPPGLENSPITVDMAPIPGRTDGARAISIRIAAPLLAASQGKTKRPRLLGVREAAALLSITPDEVIRRCEAGELTAVKGPSGTWRIASGPLQASTHKQTKHED